MKIDVLGAHREKTKFNKNSSTNSSTKHDTNSATNIDTNNLKKDTKLRSLKEAIMDVGLGLVIATILNYTILPLFVTGIENREILTMIQISIIYTAFALTRRYGMRRFFEMRKEI
jgi:hypothetical protein